MYKIRIIAKESVTILLELKTESRFQARSVALLCEENGLRCEVVREVQPVAVTFKGM